MPDSSATFTIVLDANVWVAERLLQSSLGGALLYAVAKAQATLGVPEVVELEVNQVLPEMAEGAARNIKRDIAILRQLSGQQLMVTGPTLLAVQEGIAQRWKQLSGSIERVPFDFEQANSALSRIMQKTAPCGENNEQFRDCCIWHAALTLGSDRPVHLVTADSAFYEGRKPGSGLAGTLRSEIERKGVNITIHPTIRDLLTALGDTVVAIDENAIARAIADSVTPAARDVLLTHRSPAQGKFELGEPLGWKIKGYATPKPAFYADIEYRDVTSEGLLRASSFKGLSRKEVAITSQTGEAVHSQLLTNPAQTFPARTKQINLHETTYQRQRHSSETRLVHGEPSSVPVSSLDLAPVLCRGFLLARSVVSPLLAKGLKRGPPIASRGTRSSCPR